MYTVFIAALKHDENSQIQQVLLILLQVADFGLISTSHRSINTELKQHQLIMLSVDLLINTNTFSQRRIVLHGLGL